MTRFRRFAIAALAAATVTAGSLALVPTASAMPRTCEEKWELSVYYWHIGWQFYAVRDFVSAWYYWGKSEALMVGC